MSRFWPDSLTWRIILPVVAVVIGAQILLSWFLFSALRGDIWREEQILYAQQQRDRVVALIQVLQSSPQDHAADLLKIANGPDLHAWLAPDAGALSDRHKLPVSDMKQELEFAFGSSVPDELRVSSSGMLTLLDDDFAYTVPEMLIFGHSEIEPDTLIEVEIGPQLWLRVLIASPAAEAGAGSFFDLYEFIYLCLIAGAVIPVLIIIVRRVTSPINALAGYAERIGQGGWRQQGIPEVGPLETRQAAHALNVMAQRIQDFVEDRTRMLAAISHDIASPLTGMRLQAELVEDEDIREPLIRGIEEISTMSRSTLAFARLDASDEDMRPVCLSEFVETLLKDYDHHSLSLKIAAGAGQVLVPIRPTLMRRALRNVIDNALQYGGKAELYLSAHAGGVRLDVCDAGPGLPDALLEEVFEPFFRADYSRNPDSGGTGLGLSIARNLLRLHGGDVQLENMADGGLRARISLAVAEM